ncbi:hypothetical protein JTE90_028632 [Oedothorax gibbosus]|uniref:Uncharacterized protein n=1 Tax=Oedothorax gibbosus TaxID=931172 RepID=A0AAV6UXL8_9ARAC|nr:hypothetical protein JTE90_028632 [Oedothorax gibbosus]
MHLFNSFLFGFLLSFYLFRNSFIKGNKFKESVTKETQRRVPHFAKIETEKVVETFHHIVKKILPPYPGDNEENDPVNFQSVVEDFKKVNTSRESKISYAFSRKKRNRRTPVTNETISDEKYTISTTTFTSKNTFEDKIKWTKSFGKIFGGNDSTGIASFLDTTTKFHDSNLTNMEAMHLE